MCELTHKKLLETICLAILDKFHILDGATRDFSSKTSDNSGINSTIYYTIYTYY